MVKLDKEGNEIAVPDGCFSQLGCQEKKRAQVRSVLKIPLWNPKTWNPWEELNGEKNEVEVKPAKETSGATFNREEGEKSNDSTCRWGFTNEWPSTENHNNLGVSYLWTAWVGKVFQVRNEKALPFGPWGCGTRGQIGWVWVLWKLRNCEEQDLHFKIN